MRFYVQLGLAQLVVYPFRRLAPSTSNVSVQYLRGSEEKVLRLLGSIRFGENIPQPSQFVLNPIRGCFQIFRLLNSQENERASEPALNVTNNDPAQT